MLGRVATTMLCATAVLCAPAGAATVSGKVTGPKKPGPFSVRAVDAATGVVVGSQELAKRGAFSLSVAPSDALGLLVARTPTRRSSRTLRLGRVVRVTEAGRRGVKLAHAKKKKKSKKRKARRAQALAGAVSVAYPAVWVQHFDVSGAAKELAVLRKGIADLLIAELAERPCEDEQAVVVEREGLTALLRELKRKRSPLVDRKARVAAGELIAHNATVTGTITSAGDQITITARYTDLRTGRTSDASVAGDRTGVLALRGELARKVEEILCAGGSPASPGAPDGPSATKVRFSSSGTLVWHMHTEDRPDPDYFPDWLHVFDEHVDLGWSNVPATSPYTVSPRGAQAVTETQGSGTTGFSGAVTTDAHLESWEMDHNDNPSETYSTDEHCAGTAPAWSETWTSGMQNRAAIEIVHPPGGEAVEVRWRPANYGFIGGTSGRCEKVDNYGQTTVNDPWEILSRTFGGDDQEGDNLPAGERLSGIGVATFSAAEIEALAPGQSITLDAAPMGPVRDCYSYALPPETTCEVTREFAMTITATREP